MTIQQVIFSCVKKDQINQNEPLDMSIYNPKCSHCGSEDISVLYYHAYTHIPSVYICNKCCKYHGGK